MCKCFTCANILLRMHFKLDSNKKNVDPRHKYLFLPCLKLGLLVNTQPESSAHFNSRLILFGLGPIPICLLLLSYISLTCYKLVVKTVFTTSKFVLPRGVKNVRILYLVPQTDYQPYNRTHGEDDASAIDGLITIQLCDQTTLIGGFSPILLIWTRHIRHDIRCVCYVIQAR